MLKGGVRLERLSMLRQADLPKSYASHDSISAKHDERASESTDCGSDEEYVMPLVGKAKSFKHLLRGRSGPVAKQKNDDLASEDAKRKGARFGPRRLSARKFRMAYLSLNSPGR